MYRSRCTAATSNLAMVSSPSSSLVAIARKRSTSRSTTTAYSPSLPPKCSYTTGLETPACAAISSIEVPSRPRSAKSRRPMSSSCCRRSWPVILFRLDPARGLVTAPSWRPIRNSANWLWPPGPSGRGPGRPASSGDPGRPAPGHGAQLPGIAGLLAGQPVLVGPADVADPAGFLRQPDGPGRDVDLPLQDAMARAGRVGMVQVVPGLAEGQDRQPGDVPGLVPDLELLLAEGVADGVDRPGDVVQEGDPDQAGPEECGDRALPGHRPQSADQGRREQRGGDQPGEPPGDSRHVGVGEPVRAELLLRRDVAVEQPADVGEGEALGQRPDVVPEAPRGVRVALLVAVLVVPAVIGDPGDHRALDGQRPGHCERDLEAADGLEGPGWVP